MNDETTPPGPEDQPTPAPGGDPTQPVQPASPRSRGWKIAGLIAGVAALAAAATFAAFFLLGGPSEEDAARSFLEALETEDVLGLGELLLPGERRFYFEPVLDLVDEAERLGIAGDVDLGGMQGVDLAFDDVLLEVESLADGIAWVSIDGTVSLTIEADDLPLGTLVERYLPEDWTNEVDTAGEPSDLPEEFGLVVVAHEGDWYVSWAHTIGEIARRDAGRGFPDAPALPEPGGAATPEEAMEEALLAVANLDLRALSDLLDPEETRAARRYSALFMDDWEEAIAEFREGLVDGGITYSIDEVTTESEVVDGVTVAWISDIPSFSVEIDLPDLDGVMTISRADDCLRMLVPDEIVQTLQVTVPEAGIEWSQLDGEQCVDMESPADAIPQDEVVADVEMLYDMPVFGPLYEHLMSSMEDMAESGPTIQFQITEHDGRWYVSPVQTAFRWIIAGTRTLDEELLTDLGDGIQYAAEQPEEFEAELMEYMEDLLSTMEVPLYGPEVLAPWADMPTILLVWPEDADAAVRRIEDRFGSEMILDVIEGPDLHTLFANRFGPDATGYLTPAEFPVGLSVPALDIDTLVEVFNWPEIVDLVPTESLAPLDLGEVSILGAFLGTEAEAVNAAIDDLFEASGGYSAEYTGSVSFEEEISTMLAGGSAPDIAFYPSPYRIDDLAAAGYAVALEDLGFSVEQLEAAYGPYLVSLGEHEGKHYGLPVGVQSKSLVWYHKPVFEAEGYEIPKTWEEWTALLDRMVADGYETPLCVGTGSLAATGWVATDWVEEILLRTGGPNFYDRWAAHEVPFDSPEVLHAAGLFEDMWAYVPGGGEAIPDIDFRDAAAPLFDDPPGCLLHRQGSFMSAFFPEDAVVGEDVGVFPFPEMDGGVAGALVSAEFAVVFADRPEVRAFVKEYTSTGFQCSLGLYDGVQRISPNLMTTPSCYADPIVAGIARSILDALSAGGARLDASDQMPSEVGTGTFWTGMNDWMRGVPAEDVFARIEATWPQEQ